MHREPSTLDACGVLFDVDANIATITLNRPHMGNALNAEMLGDLTAALHAAADSTSARTVLIRAIGKAFCAGGDINMLKHELPSLPQLLGNLLGPLHEAIVRLHNTGLPVVTAVNGPVGGGGIGLALCGDYVLAGQSMKMRGGYSAIGLTPDAGSAWFLAKRAGTIKAKQLLMLNEPLSAAECHAAGIVDAVYPDAELAEQSMKLAQALATGPTRVLRRIKQLLDQTEQRTLEEHLESERQLMMMSGGEEDAQEGLSAFLEKRSPRYR